jgi:hypothetical protein
LHNRPHLTVYAKGGVACPTIEQVLTILPETPPHTEELFMKKSKLLKWLQEEHEQWEAFLDQIGPERMEQPGVNGAWSMKDIIAHLTGWNHWLVARLQAAQRSQAEPSPPWPSRLQSEDEINAWIYESSQGRSLREVLDEANQVYQQLRAVIEGLPDDVRIERIEPAYFLVWVNDERFLAGEFFNHFHDDHEPDVRAWLARVEKQ